MLQRLCNVFVDVRWQSDKKTNSSVVTELTELLANNSSGYQNMDCSRHYVTKQLMNKTTHAANNSKLFQRLYDIIDLFFEVKLV